jgi:protein involved in polysaccharide export with SLBB domain
MRILIVLLFSLILFAYDKAALIAKVKENPAILDTPQAKQIMQQKGISKEKVLSYINNQKSSKLSLNQQKITNKVEINEHKKKKGELRVIDVNYISPFKFISQAQVMNLIKKMQQNEAKTKLKRFGEKFFYNKNSLNTKNLAVPDYYQVNVGDIVKIDIFGGIDKNLVLTIDNNGNITLPVIGPLYVAGMSVYSLKKLIKKKLKPTYPNSKIVIDVKVNSFIQVALTGYVKAPGIYNLNSLSTVKDLLIAANGFGNIGSMRRVYLKRNGRVIKVMDFYKLIKSGQLVDTTLLRNGDIIYVPKAKELVSLRGAVAEEAIFELLPKETLRDLIKYAGGLLPTASKKDIKIKRYLNNSKEIVYLRNYNDRFFLKNGDEVYVYNISKLNRDYVYVYGNIEKPGSFELPKDKKLSTLLKKLKFLPDTYKEYGVIKRFDGSIKSFSFKSSNIILKPKDEIFIFNKYQIKPVEYVNINGSVVKNRGKFRWYKGMKLIDIINAAQIRGIFSRDKIKIVRYDENFNPQILFVSLKDNIELKPFDDITLYSYYDFNPLKYVKIIGEVNKPGIYFYAKNLRLKDVINIGGGFTQKADKTHIEIIRYFIKNGERKSKVIITNDMNFTLKPYDEISIKTIPNWDSRKIVTLKGEVKYPGVYVIKKGEKLADVIKRAGGFTKNAYLYGAVFTRESIKRMQEKRLKNMIYKLKKKVAIIAANAKEVGQQSLNAKDLMDAIDNLAIQAEKLKPIGRIAIKLDRNLTKFENSPYDITLENNDTLYIPTKPDSVIVMGEVLTPSAFVYTTDSALKYIKLAGGKTSVADDIYFVVHANGFTDKGEFGRWFNDDIKVKPGDAITIPIQIKTATWYGIAKDITAIVYQLAITSASLKTVGAF